MKINFRHAILACAALAIGLTSCVKNNGGDIDTTEGTETYARFNFSFPAATRATDEGIAAESVVNTVEVFIFKGTQRENYVLLSASDFTPTGNLYKADTLIKTTEGAKKVYVGVNLPAALEAASIVNETQFTSLVRDIPNNELVVYTGTDLARLAMFSATPATPTLVAWDGVDPVTIPTSNQVTIPVQRMVAKAAASEGATLNTTITDLASFSDLQFKVAGVLKQTFIGRNVVGGVIQSPDYAQGATVNVAMYSDTLSYVNVNASGLSTNDSDFNAQYAPENTNAEIRRMGETTRIVVKANVQPAFVYSFANAGTAWGDWNRTANTAAATTDFYMVETISGWQYFFLAFSDEATTITNIGNFMNAYIAEYGVAGDTPDDHFNASRNVTGETPAAHITKYTGGVCYWNKLWLNLDGASNGLGGTGTAENVGQTYRNDFYHLSINNITGIGDGSEGIIDPEKPIVNKESHLEVTMEILPWNYYATGVDL